MKINKVLTLPTLPCAGDEIFFVKTGSVVEAYMSNSTGTELHRILIDKDIVTLEGPLEVNDNADNANVENSYVITNFDAFNTYSITADHGTILPGVPVQATESLIIPADNFKYIAPVNVPVSGHDNININGEVFPITINKTIYSYTAALGWASDLQNPLSTYSVNNTGFIYDTNETGGHKYFKLIGDVPSLDYNILVEYPDDPIVNSTNAPVVYDQLTGIGYLDKSFFEQVTVSERRSLNIYLTANNGLIKLGRLKVIISGNLDGDYYEAGMFISYSNWQDREFYDVTDYTPTASAFMYYKITDSHNADTYNLTGDPHYQLTDEQIMTSVHSYNLNNSNYIDRIITSLGDGSHITRIPFAYVGINSNGFTFAMKHEGFSNILDSNNQLPAGFVTLVQNESNPYSGMVKFDPTVINNVSETLGFIRILRQYPNGDFLTDAIYIGVYIDRMNGLPNTYVRYTFIPGGRFNSFPGI
jgi:hypothetical protein